MFALSVATPVNPPGSAPQLTAQQVWEGLVMKAENALPFVSAMTRCEVLERGPDELLREIALGDQVMRERVTFTPRVQVRFDRVGDTPHQGWITNVISESELGLLLTFTFAIASPGGGDDPEAERARVEAMRSGYAGAVRSTLQRVRELVAAGRL